MNEVFTRRIQKHGTSIVIAIPPDLRKYGYELGVKVNMWEENGKLILCLQDESICSHCNGLTVCRCPECAAKHRIIKRPVIVAVKCSYCNGKGYIKK